MIEKLRTHYSFTNPATVHDEEALTALELAGRQGAKINEIVNDQNSLRTETEGHLKNQDENIEHIRTVTVPEDVKAECQRLIEKGEFDEAINIYMDNLNERVNNLLGSVTEGSTTLDAEVIDGRGNYQGTFARNIGENIRNADAYTNARLDYIYNSAKPLKIVDLNPYMNQSYILDNSGKYVELTSSSAVFFASNAYPVEPGKLFYIEASAFNTNAFYVFYDKDDAVIDMKNAPGSTDTFKGLVTAPLNADHIRISGVQYNSLGRLCEVETISIVDSNEETYLNNLSGYIPSIVNGNQTIEIESIIRNNYILQQSTGLPVAMGNDSSNTYNITEPIEVEPGKIYKIVGSTRLECWDYVFFDMNGDFLSGVKGENASHNFEYFACAPKNATTIMISNYKGLNQPKLYEVSTSFVDTDKPWSHLKWCALGDSLTEANLRTTKNYHDYIAEKTGISVVNMGASGTGYKRTEDEGKAFYQRVSNIPTDTDVITIFGSGNDNTMDDVLGNATDTGTETLCGCINTTIDNIYNLLPTVQLGIVSPCPWQGRMPSDGGPMLRYSNKLKEICELRGIPFLDLYHCSGLRPNDETYRNLVYSKDDGGGVHPNEIGHKILSSHFYNFLNSLIGTY